MTKGPIDEALDLMRREADALASAERVRITEIKAALDPLSSPSVAELGRAPERGIGDFAASCSRQTITGEAASALAHLTELRQLVTSVASEAQRPRKGLAGFIRSPKREAAKLARTFATARSRSDALIRELEEHARKAEATNEAIDKLCTEHLPHFRDLLLRIAAGKEVLADFLNGAAAQTDGGAGTAGSAAAATSAERHAAADRLARKVMNLEKSRDATHAAIAAARRLQQTGRLLAAALRAVAGEALPAWHAATQARAGEPAATAAATPTETQPSAGHLEPTLADAPRLLLAALREAEERARQAAAAREHAHRHFKRVETQLRTQQGAPLLGAAKPATVYAAPAQQD